MPQKQQDRENRRESRKSRSTSDSENPSMDLDNVTAVGRGGEKVEIQDGTVQTAARSVADRREESFRSDREADARATGENLVAEGFADFDEAVAQLGISDHVVEVDGRTVRVGDLLMEADEREDVEVLDFALSDTEEDAAGLAYNKASSMQEIENYDVVSVDLSGSGIDGYISVVREVESED